MTQTRCSQATVIVIPCPGGSRPAMARVCPADGGFMPIIMPAFPFQSSTSEEVSA